MEIDRMPWLAALLGVLLSAAPAAASPPQTGKSPWTVEDILRLRDLSDPQVSPDGRWVVFVVSEADDQENAFNTDLYLASMTPPPAGSVPADPLRLTRSPKPDHHPRWSPDGRMIAFLSGRETPGPAGEAAEDKEEKTEQAWLIRAEGGEPSQPGRVDGNVEALAWSPDGTILALLVREPKSADRKRREKEKDDAILVDAGMRRSQVWLMDAASGACVQVTRGALHFTDLDWSADGRRLALAGQPTPKVPDDFRSDIYTLDLSKARDALHDNESSAEVALGEPVPVVSSRGSDTRPRWSPDGSTIAFLTQDGSDEWYTNIYVASVPAAGGAARILTRSFDEEADGAAYAPDGRSITFEGQARLSHHLLRVPLGGGEVRPLTRGDEVHRAVSFSRDGRVAALVHESVGEPPEIFAATTARDGTLASLRPVTGLNRWAGGYATLVKAPMRWKGADGMEIEGQIVRPADRAPGRRYPLLTIVHGGPAGVFYNTFSVRRGVYPVQLFAQKGFAVLMPNPRGSGGYGEAFRKANVRDWGEKDYEDILAGVDALVASGVADPERLGIMGWSYGGFMTSRIITKTKRFKAASVGAGVTDTFSFTGVADIPPFMRSYFGAWPWEEPAIYTSRTALFNAKGVATPTLIQHGEADVRVPISQGWELYVALKEQGVPVEFVTYPRQGHALTEPKLLRDAMRRNLEWFSRWILGEKPAP